MVDEFGLARDVGYLHLESLEPSLAERASATIQGVARGILAGAVKSTIVDNFGSEATQSQYFEGLRQLIEIAERR